MSIRVNRFQRSVRDSITRLAPGGIHWREGRRWWGKGTDGKPLEIDLVAESIDKKTLLIGEASLKLNRNEYEQAFHNLQTKTELLPIVSRYKNRTLFLFVAKKPGTALPKLWSKKVIHADALFQPADPLS